MGTLTQIDVQFYIDKYNLFNYVETGTGMATSLSYALLFPFENLYSIDIDKEFVELARTNFSDDNLKICSCKSVEVLPDILEILSNNTLFFLDAHFPGADYGKISYEESIRTHQKDAFPLEEEIRLIVENRDITEDVFIIDDLVLYEGGDYDTIQEGIIWKYEWLQKELGLETDSSFIYDIFGKTHDFTKDLRSQGYLIITPKEN